MIIKSKKVDAVRKREITHMDGHLLYWRGTTKAMFFPNEPDSRDYTVGFSVDDLKALKKVVAELEEQVKNGKRR